jgi:Tfp pilus assembly protein PilF
LLLATTYRSWQRHDRAEEHYRAALAVPGLDDATRGSLEERWKAN